MVGKKNRNKNPLMVSKMVVQGMEFNTYEIYFRSNPSVLVLPSPHSSSWLWKTLERFVLIFFGEENLTILVSISKMATDLKTKE